MQYDVESRSAKAKNDLCQFSQHIASLLVEVSKGHIRDLDAHLITVRDGVVSDEEAMKRCKVPRCTHSASTAVHVPLYYV